MAFLLVSKVIDFGTSRKRVYDFLLVPHSNVGPILPLFRAIAGFILRNLPRLYFTLTWGSSRWTTLPMLGSIRACALRYSAVKYFRSIPTCVIKMAECHRQTDRQTDNLALHNRTLRSIVRQKRIEETANVSFFQTDNSTSALVVLRSVIHWLR